jgi:vacuolar protein sorting-associated protein VTA1
LYQIYLLAEWRVYTSCQHQDKVRYAKWKAADIAKAFREGRKPLPGPAGGEAPELPSLVGLVAPGEIQAVTSADIPHVDTGDIERANLGFLGISSPPTAHEATSPGEWSTAATPGVENNIFGAIGEGRGGPVPRDEPHQDERSNEVIDEFGTGVRHPAAEAPLGRAESSASIVDGDVAATDLPKANGNADALDIEPTPSPAPILSPSAARRSPKSPPKNVSFAPTPASPSRNPPPPPPPPSEDMVATRTPVQRAGALPPVGIVPPPGAIISNHTLDGNPAVPPPPVLYVSAPPPALPQVDLTPQLIAKIQRNCRFAISALDYEDAETARKELRAALASLGG